MPLADDPSRSRGRVLTRQDGTPLARFVEGTRDRRRLADLLEPEPGADREAVADAIARELAGWKVAADPQTGRALVARGARPTRHAHIRSRDLAEHPPDEPARPPAGVTLGPLDRSAAELAELYAAAYPPGHADWTYIPAPVDYAADLAAVLDGVIAGPLLESSRLATTRDGTPVGVLAVTEIEGAPPVGGPWVAELFRAPGAAYRGTGRALLLAGMHAARQAGLGTLGLAVSDGNPAERLYASLGFELVLSSLVVVIPG
jgi:L-amino acid N-acyltransferase YncA